MSKKDEKSEKTGGGWAGKAAIAGAAIGSAALAAAVLYASRRKDRAGQESKPGQSDQPETD